MIIGVPREIKPEEHRVSVTPDGVKLLVQHGHQVLVEGRAGMGCGFPDSAFKESGGMVVQSPLYLWRKADLILKVKEPLESEFSLMRKDQIIFTFLHLAANDKLTDFLLTRGVVGVAYETVQRRNGSLPILKPMSEIAGYLSVQLAAQGLEVKNGGRGILMGGAEGVPPAMVTVLGGGAAGSRAAEVASGMEARVAVLEIDEDRIRRLRRRFGKAIDVIRSTVRSVEQRVACSDVVIGSVLKPGARAPTLITKDGVKGMKPGSVIVDITVDQGGCIETIRPTTHASPFYSLYNVVHCGITNLPSAVPFTSTLALTRASLPYVLEIANKGIQRAVNENPAIRKGVNVMKGKVTNQAVAETFGIPYYRL